jgi:hypothetical protein
VIVSGQNIKPQDLGKPTQTPARPKSRHHRLALMAGLVLFFALLLALLRGQLASHSPRHNRPPSPGAGESGTASRSSSAPALPPTVTTNAPAMPTTSVNEAVMVTVELDFGPRVPSIAEGLREVERRHQPDDRVGRVFSILDAYGEPTPDGKKLHMSMHVSAEKPGMAALVFRRTGETLWQSRVVPGSHTNMFSGKNLTVFISDDAGKTFIVDGSGNPASIVDARLRDNGLPVGDFWPDGAEREVSFIYSACGCPVKAAVRRIGQRTARTKELPVIFPDDPAAVQFIERLMGWTASP